MKRIGQLLIAAGFLVGALVSVVDETFVPWIYFSVGLAVGVVGVVLVNVGERRTARAILATGAGVDELEASLYGIVQSLESLDAEKQEVNPYEMRHRIDDTIPAFLTTFVEARESVIHIYSLQAYADVMSQFAAGERHLNRVWSASADGYVDEVNEYLPRARHEFEQALEMLRDLGRGP